MIPTAGEHQDLRLMISFLFFQTVSAHTKSRR